MSFISQFWLQLLEVVRHLGPVEIIDVIVVTFVLYQLLRLLRGTQGTQILVGLVLLAVVGFEDHAATGVRIIFEISAEMLQSIFYPHSPLHDGAVIVRGNRIVAAGCLLPLPEEGTVRERLGTRHRAALGLSLASDALVLVISEETGNISVIEEGKINRNLDADDLRRRIAPRVSSPNGNGIFRFRR